MKGGMKAREREESDGLGGGRKWRLKEARCVCEKGVQ